MCAVRVSVGQYTYIHTHIHTYTPQPTYILDVHTCVVYVHTYIEAFTYLYGYTHVTQMRTALFWIITQRVEVISYRPFLKPVSPILRVQEPPPKGKSAVLSYFVAEALKPRTLRS